MSSHCFKSGPLGCDQGLYKMHLTSFMVQPSAKTEGLWRMQLSHQALDAVTATSQPALLTLSPDAVAL